MTDRSTAMDDLDRGDRIGVFTGPVVRGYFRGRFHAISKDNGRYWLFLLLDGEQVPTGVCTEQVRHIERIEGPKENGCSIGRDVN